MRRIVTLLLSLIVTLSIPFQVFAAPRGVACGNCHRGSLFEKTLVESVEVVFPCIHGHSNATDTHSEFYQNVYLICNSCGARVKVSEQKLNYSIVNCNFK